MSFISYFCPALKVLENTNETSYQIQSMFKIITWNFHDKCIINVEHHSEPNLCIILVIM